MTEMHSGWRVWAQILQRWGLREPAALLLESLGPFSILIAQFAYVAQPFFGSQARELADLLEDPQQTHIFAAFLREEGNQ